MTTNTLTFLSTAPEQTARIAVGLAKRLSAGDVLLLEGDIGAGKTHFARALIQSMLGATEDVPSPTFTLVQTYQTSVGDIWHADLYRLTSAHEIEELGLIDAFETDVCLVEWPDRLGALAPDHALTLMFAPGQSDDARVITAHWSDPRWQDKLKDLKT